MDENITPPPHYAILEQAPPADTSFVKHKFLNIPYASLSPSQKLDIYLPEDQPDPSPVIVSIHGGAFMGCDKADMQLMPALEGLKRGYAVVAINYRLSWQAQFPALVQDAKAAVRWIRANAQRYRLNPDKIATWGGSAGGYLSVMLGTSSGISELEDLSLGNPNFPCNVQAVVDWFGPMNFLVMDEQLAASGFAPPPEMAHNGEDSPESLLLGAKITEIPERVKAANPETYIRSNVPPFLIQHGTLDMVVPCQQSMGLAEKLRTAIGAQHVTLELLEGAGHGEDPLFLSPENINKVLDFLDGYLR